MATLGEMQDRIADDLNRSDIATQIKKAINRAFIYYEKEPWWFKEANDTFSTSASAKSYNASDGVASDIKRIEYVEIIQNSSAHSLEQKDISFIQQSNPNDSTGFPQYFAWWENKIWFSPVPSQAWDVKVYYTKKYTEITATTSTNDFLSYAEDLIESRARKWLNLRVLKNTEQGLVAAQEEEEALQALRSKNEDYASLMKVTPTCF
jgi:hypothetical protein